MQKWQKSYTIWLVICNRLSVCTHTVCVYMYVLLYVVSALLSVLKVMKPRGPLMTDTIALIPYQHFPRSKCLSGVYEKAIIVLRQNANHVYIQMCVNGPTEFSNKLCNDVILGLNIIITKLGQIISLICK